MRASPSLSLAFPALSLLLSLSLAACGGRASSEGTSDGGPEAEATPASGGGVCCPIVSDPCSACGSSLGGGWAASASACGAIGGPCDGKIGFGTDDHGCAVLATGDNVPGAACCGCAVPEAGATPTCTDAGTSWTCPPQYGGSIAACPATATQGAACTAGSGLCFYCEEGAGIGCGCDASPDGGSVWMCVGAGVACE